MKNQDFESKLDEIRKIDEIRVELKGLQGKLEQAQQSIKELRVKAKEKIAVEKQLLLTGHNLLAKGELEEAIHNYQKAIALQPGLKKLPEDSLAQLKSVLLNTEAEKLTKNGHKDTEEKINYTRLNPSPRYQELLAMYQQMHAHGSPEYNIPAKTMFAGQSLSRQALKIKELIEKYQGKSLLDYGSGKAMAYRTKFVPPNQKDKVFPNIQTFWGIEQLTCYDPAYIENSNLPTGKFDAVICTDVLEHCPEQDMPWIVEEIFSFASKFVYANVSCRPAAKRLPNGENAHCTVKSIEWWKSLINSVTKNYPSISYYFWFDVAKQGPVLLKSEVEKSNGHKDTEEKINYTRLNPSPRYQELLAMYQQMHAHGSPEYNIPAKTMFAGQSLSRQALKIKELIEKYQGKSLLDYGSGKAMAYRNKFVPPNQKDKVFPNIQTFWGIEQLTCYDPAYIENSNLPIGKFDAVICTDVLEHCPEQDMPWIVEEIFSFASKFVYANVSCRPAGKRLPNGENAHCTVKSIEWWKSLINSVTKNYPSISYYFWFDVAKQGPVLLKSETEKLTEHQGSFEDNSGFTSQAILENLIYAVKNSDCSNTPFSNFYMENCFSQEVYQAILNNLPSDEVYKDLKHRDALRSDGSSSRGSFSLIDQKRLELLSNQQRTFWKIITEALSSDALKKVVFEQLKEDLASRYQVDQKNVTDIKAFPKLLLLRDWDSYQIKPHPDSPEKIVTMQFYLPENLSQIGMGTSIYEIDPETQKKKLFKTYDFKPNSGYAFAVTNTSIHGVKKLSISNSSQVRNTMMVIYSTNPNDNY